VAHVHPAGEVLAHLSDEQKGALLGRWFGLLSDIAGLLQETWDRSKINRATMIVRRGNDSSTWNNTAGAWNKARDHWFALVYALNMDDLLDSLCPGKVLRLMAADVVAWHHSAGNTLDPNTAVWNELPLPWEVLSGQAVCTRAMVEAACRRHGLDPEKSGWTAPRPAHQGRRVSPDARTRSRRDRRQSIRRHGAAPGRLLFRQATGPARAASAEPALEDAWTTTRDTFSA
jgi:hypothetical protein